MMYPRRLAARFASDRSGSIAIIFALVAIPAIGITSVAIDYGRLLKARWALQFAADAAARAAADDVLRPDEALARDVRANLDGNLPADLSGIPYQMAVANDRSTVSVRVTHRIKTSLMGIAGIDELETGALGTARSELAARAAARSAEGIREQMSPQASRTLEEATRRFGGSGSLPATRAGDVRAAADNLKAPDLEQVTRSLEKLTGGKIAVPPGGSFGDVDRTMQDAARRADIERSLQELQNVMRRR